MTPVELNRVLAWLDLRNDAVFNKIPPAKYRYYLDNALAAGEQAASEFHGKNIRDLYAENGIDIQLKQGDGLFFTVQFRAQFEYSEVKSIRRVTLYQPSLESLQRSCEQSGLQLPLSKIIDIHLAHEFFHFLEHHRHQPVGATLEKVCHVSLGPFRSYSTVCATSEIAAHRFCQVLNGLEHYPTYYDFLWLVHSGKQTEREKDELFAHSWQELSQM
ncbi:hypothetical protein M976_03276 [Buttiauxella ferragutiae ATCC 51602]|uniref:Uncharacterized protein n=1 Tax=Buttiauxella ferragutiae ATCC 51602 TaxID=1354252 RepID=A0ABX2W5B9_9ENTR|nr:MULTISPECIES: hypothetical protein [Buttiauxella]AYN26016.1 hypothetical protein D8682_02810 [Buttiauxella sp. 3AFRM03]MCE0824713.1 hypothetical protein [Buttiauxella ferragutiae]OAT25984.1 hypothetical protein M976_03276 [Buttiauxella ferragutiae ATCC 51602]UNK59273.1 hypothetical protein MNO13_12675 [Buttiauxella ferragutiae]